MEGVCRMGKFICLQPDKPVFSACMEVFSAATLLSLDRAV